MEIDKVVVKWNVYESEFKQAIEDNRPDIEDADAFWKKHEDEIVRNFEQRFWNNVRVFDVGMLINDAIDEVCPCDMSRR